VTVLASTLAIGGAEQLLLDLLRAMDRDRFQVDIIYLREPGPIGQEIARLGIPAEQGVLRSRLQLSTPWRLASMLRERGTKVLLIINHLNALFYGVPAARLAGVNAVVNWHNETNRRYHPHALVMSLRCIVHRGVDRIVAAAKGHKEYIVAAEGVPADKVEVIYNGVDTTSKKRAMPRDQARLMLDLPMDAPVASIVAGLRPDKDHAVFLRAARLVLDQLPEAYFLVAGDGPRKGELTALAAELELGDHVRFLGFRRDIPDILSATDVIALSSRPWQETLSVAMLEAMATGIPAVVTDVGFLGEVVREGINGHLVPPGDPHALSDRLAWLMADREMRARLGAQAALDVGMMCSVEAMAAEFERLFHQLAQCRR
jgi:glycosyltransferase involved in cell wall biosynthesis